MEFLYFLESIRNPVLDSIMLFITRLGEETVFLAVALFILWCVDKYEGYYLMFVGFLGTQLNQLLKVLVRIDRPWVRDPDFTAVEAAKPGATGYSFPSGHTQSSVGSFAALARWNKNKILRIISISLCILIPFSRMYLGVHTPADVLTSVVLALILVFTLYPLINRLKSNHNAMRIMLLIMVLWSLAQLIFMELFHPENADSAQLYSGLLNAYKIFGAVLGVAAAFELDIRFIRFETKAAWWTQILKLVIGVAFTLAVKELGYILFSFIPYSPLSKAIAYFFTVLFAAAVWPATFKFFSKTAKNKVSTERYN